MLPGAEWKMDQTAATVIIGIPPPTPPPPGGQETNGSNDDWGQGQCYKQWQRNPYSITTSAQEVHFKKWPSLLKTELTRLRIQQVGSAPFHRCSLAGLGIIAGLKFL